MEPFIRITERAVPIMIDDVDTDMIFPARFARTVSDRGFGACLFAGKRFDAEGRPTEAFPLNEPAYRGARILIAGSNFGCGSSREHAVWALRDFGFRAVVAPSFAEIFRENCFNNGLLPVTLARGDVLRLAALVEADPALGVGIDLEEGRISAPGLGPLAFETDPYRRDMLLNGLDAIGLSLKSTDDILRFETAHFARQPWLERGATGKERK